MLSDEQSASVAVYWSSVLFPITAKYILNSLEKLSKRYQIFQNCLKRCILFLLFGVVPPNNIFCGIRTVTRVSMFSPAVSGSAETRRHAKLGSTSLVLRCVTRRVVAHNACVDPNRWVRGTFPGRNRWFRVARWSLRIRGAMLWL